jgi:hypothetical protein
MSGESGFTRSWQVGKYTATLSCARPQPGQAMAASIEWDPSLPDRLSDQEVAAYRAGRDHALAELSVEMNVHVAVKEI